MMMGSITSGRCLKVTRSTGGGLIGRVSAAGMKNSSSVPGRGDERSSSTVSHPGCRVSPAGSAVPIRDFVIVHAVFWQWSILTAVYGTATVRERPSSDGWAPP
jgi:hypothetical protein